MTHDTLVILAFDQALPSALIGIADMLALAQISQRHSPSRYAETTDQAPIHWQPQVITASSEGKKILDGQGRSFTPDCAFEDVVQCQAVLIPGFVPCADGLPPNPITNRACRTWLQRQSELGTIIGGSCSGAFVMGEAGLLNNRRCTTTWWLHYELSRRFPKCNAAWGSALVQDGKTITAGGPLSWVDISLRIIRLLAGDNAANRAADFAVVDTSPSSQNRYIPQGHLLTADPFLIAAENAIRQHLDKSLTTIELATQLAVSERTLHRRIKRLTNEAPKAFIDRIRMESAKTLLHTSDLQVNYIALQLGYSDLSVFRRLFRKHVGMSPLEYRRWYNQRGGEK